MNDEKGKVFVHVTIWAMSACDKTATLHGPEFLSQRH